MSARTTSPQRPYGFGFAAVVCGFYAVHGVGHLLAAPAVGGGSLSAGAAKLATIVMAAVVSEALWAVRPWAARAVATLGAAVIAWLLATGTGLLPLIAAAVAFRLTVYVGDQVRAFYGVGVHPRRPVAVNPPSPGQP